MFNIVLDYYIFLSKRNKILLYIVVVKWAMIQLFFSNKIFFRKSIEISA